jgi:hypothetical protein
MASNLEDRLDRVIEGAKRLAGATDQRVQRAEERNFKRAAAEARRPPADDPVLDPSLPAEEQVKRIRELNARSKAAAQRAGVLPPDPTPALVVERLVGKDLLARLAALRSAEQAAQATATEAVAEREQLRARLALVGRRQQTLNEVLARAGERRSIRLAQHRDAEELRAIGITITEAVDEEDRQAQLEVAQEVERGQLSDLSAMLAAQITSCEERAAEAKRVAEGARLERLTREKDYLLQKAAAAHRLADAALRDLADWYKLSGLQRLTPAEVNASPVKPLLASEIPAAITPTSYFATNGSAPSLEELELFRRKWNLPEMDPVIFPQHGHAPAAATTTASVVEVSG